MGTSTKFKSLLAVLAVLTAAGLGAYGYQLANGLEVTGMNNGTSWGLYITMFMFFVGLSAGGLIVASSASVFNVKDFKKVALPAVIVSTVCICVAGMFILIDLGGIQRVWRIFAGPNFISPLLWDVTVITMYLIINLFYLYFMTSTKPGAADKVKIVSRFALPVAILVHSVTAWIFGLEMAKEGWYSAIMAPLFVASAMDSGLALLIVGLVGLDKAGWFKVEKALISKLAALLAVCVAVDGFFIFCEVLTMVYPGAAGAHTFAIMATGSMAPFFWFEIVCGVVVPFAILVFDKCRQNTKLVTLACAGIVLGVYCKRVWLLFTSFMHYNVAGAPGVISGSSAAANGTGSNVWAVVSSYTPTMIEFVVVIGVISLGLLAFLILCKFFFSKLEKAN